MGPPTCYSGVAYPEDSVNRGAGFRVLEAKETHNPRTGNQMMPNFERPMAGRITDDHDVGQEYRRRIGRHIAGLRHKAGLTGRELGLLVGMGPTAISAIETGRNPLPPERYEDFAKALHVSREEFAKFLLEHTNPWLYGMMFHSAKTVAQRVKSIPERATDFRQ